MNSTSPRSASPPAGSERRRWLQFAAILFAVGAIASAASHGIVNWFGIKASWGGNHHYGPKEMKAQTILHGSSLAYDGLYWDRISETFGGAVESWATPGSTPSEWEVMHLRAPDAKRTCIVFSPYDLNEFSLCDFRADIVPGLQTIRDLWQGGADWPFSKRVLSQYPMMMLRKLFPTVGRSDGVMVGMRSQLQRLVQGGSRADSGEAPKFGAEGASVIEERLSEWDVARLQRRLVLMRGGCQGRHSFDGPKQMALKRLVQRAARQGEVIFAVMPVSPVYQKEFLNSEVKRSFEGAVEAVWKLCPEALLIRVDQLPALQDSAMFYDLVHLNKFGQQIATAEFLNQLSKQSSRP